MVVPVFQFAKPSAGPMKWEIGPDLGPVPARCYAEKLKVSFGYRALFTALAEQATQIGSGRRWNLRGRGFHPANNSTGGVGWLIPLSETHLRSNLNSSVNHYNRGRAHMGLGPGVPNLPTDVVLRSIRKSRHSLEDFRSVRARAVLGDLCPEYSLALA